MKHNPYLDGIRFIAIFLVLLEHFAVFVGPRLSAGYYGVDLFFVLSGFLITGILLRSDGSFGERYRTFLGRRILRIFPIYYLLIFSLYLAGNVAVREYLLSCLSYTVNYNVISAKPTSLPIVHLWSLSVEEQFYLIWPLLVLTLRKKTLSFIIVVVCAFCIIQQSTTFFTFPSQFVLFPYAFPLLLGALSAVWLQDMKKNRFFKSRLVEIAAFVLLLFLLVTTFQIKYLLCPLLSLFFVAKTAAGEIKTKAARAILCNRKAQYIGTISYGIYLYHLPLAYYFGKYFFDPLWSHVPFASFGIFRKVEFHSWIIKFPLYSLLSIGLAHLSFKYLEKPILSLKDKWFAYPKKKSREAVLVA